MSKGRRAGICFQVRRESGEWIGGHRPNCGYENCPTCDSPAPHLHPAIQAEGEVHVCPDGFHKQDTPENYRHLERGAVEAEVDRGPEQP